MHRVFVYGSLIQGMGNHWLLKGSIDKKFANLIGKAVTKNKFKMITFHEKCFPYVLFDSIPIKNAESTEIIGEIYEVDDSTLKKLDNLESHPNWYKREMIQTSIGNAWMYIMQDKETINNFDKYLCVNNGDWFDFKCGIDILEDELPDFENINTMKNSELKFLIKQANLSYENIIEREELIDLARKSLKKIQDIVKS